MNKSKEILRFIAEAKLPKEIAREFKFAPFLFPDDKLSIKAIAQNPERSYEDREVYTEFNFSKKPLDGKIINNQYSTWLTGEKSIELGTMLIEAGNDALTRSRLKNYETIELLAAANSAQRGLYKEVIITRQNDETPNDYGPGFYYYTFYYKADDDLYSRKIKDVVYYFSPFKDEFNKQIKNFTFGIPYKLVNFSYDLIKSKFDKSSKDFE